MQIKFDREYHFRSVFDPSSGIYIRSSMTDENGRNTGKDPFMASYPELIDVGVMGKCVCAGKCKVDCYQVAVKRTGNNMSVENFRRIAEESKGRCFSFALGGAGDVDTHESFEEILSICKQNHIVPNFTTSGLMMTKEKADICREYCGAVAVSEHFTDYTDRAVDMLLDAGVKTNIHYVLGNNSIEKAISMLENNSFPEDINAVVFLLYKPVGLGVESNVLNIGDPRVKKFFRLVDEGRFPFSVGFDSCSLPGIVNLTKNINPDTLDYCEGARFSAYIDAEMHMMPCSFANQDLSWHVDLNKYSIKEAWNSPVFERFRYSLRHSCYQCKKRGNCGGGCPIVNQITLCESTDRDFKEAVWDIKKTKEEFL